ncbi:MAG: PHP domain-containing protein [Eubacterium sp.]|nr:PHP domain-containing protein [Candidatus Colimonas fimequi]
MWKIDYHIHTTLSDGASLPQQVVKAAASMGMESIAITDHDGTDGVAAALKQGKESGIKVVTGIEFATDLGDGTGLRILGYGFDPEHPIMRDKLEFMNEKRRERNVKLLKVLQGQGFDIAYEELKYGRANEFIGKPVIARTMVKKGYLTNYKDAFTPGLYLESPEARAVKKVKVDSVEAIDIINKAGGVAVLAHPIQAKGRGKDVDETFFAWIDGVIGKLTDAGLYGLECYHKDHDITQTKRFLDMAGKYGLKVSRGTDFHGEDYVNREENTIEFIDGGSDSGYGIFPRDFMDV